MRKRILFVDDDADIREMMEILLSHAGFNVGTTFSSTEVYALIDGEHFDAILLDNWMPETTGVELCQRIRVKDQSTPIVFCSGALTPDDIRIAKSAGAKFYVATPFDPDELISILLRGIRCPNSKGLSDTGMIDITSLS
jgi:DNA-binding response OmpR family regulator